MFFERFYDTDLAQASYMVGCQKTGECLVIDPVRDIQKYLDKAAEQKLRVTHVTETHIHADYLSGSRELAAATGRSSRFPTKATPTGNTASGAKSCATATPSWWATSRWRRGIPRPHARKPVLSGDGYPRGNVPVMYFTGDFVFVGDIGRPDLLDEAAGGQDTRFVGARQMFASLRDQFLTLPDGVQVWPAHGSGSACGKALGAVPSTTVGHERALAWWSAYVQKGDEQGFTAELLSGQPDAPLYYGRMKEQNKSGPAVLGEVAPLPEFSAAEVGAKLAAGTVLIDTRAKERHQAAAPRHSVNIPAGNTFETWSGWLLRPEDADYVLLTRAPSRPRNCAAACGWWAWTT
ncbi:MBL fold metallo-hydrolase [Deinococcus wulumuqiensis]|uniref:MBL fold metallo-hydrolase n=1 Tax=Deinococcus wulumuqiensis TaxID=980427 RepID=UPI001CEF9F85|nr:MBL fold metallo-hydrolase [Deinococcus wulumuqiensis]